MIINGSDFHIKLTTCFINSKSYASHLLMRERDLSMDIESSNLSKTLKFIEDKVQLC